MSDDVTLPSGIVDAHAHILPAGLDATKLHLGHCVTREQVLHEVALRAERIEDGEWLLAVHYDQTRFPDGRHLTRDELDSVCGDRPVLLRHSNGHAAVANSAALTAAGVDEATKDPPGGQFARDPAGRLTGVVLERAAERLSAAAPAPTLEQMVRAICECGRRLHELGIVAAADMMTGRWGLETELDAYRMAMEQGCPIRLALYPQWSALFGTNRISQSALDLRCRQLEGSGCHIAGIKIFADGAIGSATAAIYGRYLTSPPSDQDTDGQLIYDPARLRQMIQTADQAGYQVAVHSIGDRSTDAVMDALQILPDPSRHRIEHAMILSDAQIERLARLGVAVVMQPEFLLRFGHAYRRQLGEERAARLKRAHSLIEAGIPLAFSSDLPIVPGDPRDGLRCATNRPDGFDPSENLAWEQAVASYTVNAARVCGWS